MGMKWARAAYCLYQFSWRQEPGACTERWRLELVVSEPSRGSAEAGKGLEYITYIHAGKRMDAERTQTQRLVPPANIAEPPNSPRSSVIQNR